MITNPIANQFRANSICMFGSVQRSGSDLLLYQPADLLNTFARLLSEKASPIRKAALPIQPECHIWKTADACFFCQHFRLAAIPHRGWSDLCPPPKTINPAARTLSHTPNDNEIHGMAFYRSTRLPEASKFVSAKPLIGALFILAFLAKFRKAFFPSAGYADGENYKKFPIS